MAMGKVCFYFIIILIALSLAIEYSHEGETSSVRKDQPSFHAISVIDISIVYQFMPKTKHFLSL